MAWINNDKELKRADMSLLENKKPERTTFKLSMDARKGLEWLQKRARNLTFDKIMDAIISSMLEDRSMPIQEIANMIRGRRLAELSARKTYVVSRGNLKTLNDVSRIYEIPRNDLISKLIELYKAKEEIRIKEIMERRLWIKDMLLGFKENFSDLSVRIGEKMHKDDVELDEEFARFNSAFYCHLGMVFEKLES